MHGQMPQEIEVWYIIPALRREICKSMVEEHMLTQKEVAKHVHLTEAAVSQYLSSKRAKDIVFSKPVLEEIKKSAGKIIKDKKPIVSEMMRLCELADVKHVMCNIHKKQDAKLPNGCEICLKKS